MRRAALLTFVIAIAAFFVFGARPWATKKHDFPAAISSPAPLRTIGLAEVPGRGQVCMRDVTIDPRAAFARFRVGTYGKPGVPLDVTIAGDGYRASASIPGGWADNIVQQIRVSPPSEAKVVRVCITNKAANKIAFYATQDQEVARTAATVNGKPIGVTPQFGFWEKAPRAIDSHVSLTVDRIALLRGPLGHPWMVWTIFALTLLALTGGVGWLIWIGLRVPPR
jgi:hypothetical protein